MKEELINYNKKISEFDYKKLSAMKSLEAEKKEVLHRVKINNGYVYTTDPDKYKHIAR